MNPILFELKLLCKKRAVLVLGISYVIISLITFCLGLVKYETELSEIAQLKANFSEDKQYWKNKVHESGVGYAAYYLFNPIFAEPSPISTMFRGEKEENLSIQRVRLLAVHGQIHGNPLNNPGNFVFGKIDLGFLWIYLMPVLAGLITVTCISAELRKNNLIFLSSLIPINKLIFRRIFARYFFLLFLNFLTLLGPTIILADLTFVDFLKISSGLIIYQSIWFVLIGLITFQRFNARKSILTFVAIWIGLSWAFPAIHYNWNLSADSYNTGIEMLVKQRQDMNDSWDRNKSEDFQSFLKEHPQWENTEKLKGRFEWKWYYAMQFRSDEKVSNLAEKYFHQKENTNSIWSYLSLPLIFQKYFEGIAETSSKDHVDFLRKVVSWHDRSKNFWFPYFFFENEDFKSEDLDKIPKL